MQHAKLGFERPISGNGSGAPRRRPLLHGAAPANDNPALRAMTACTGTCGYAVRMQPPAHIRIGISGWRYAPWRGNFYPAGLPQRRELHFAAQRFGAIEINGSFYSLQHPASYAEWYAQTPADFQFAVKGGRFITHLKRLADIERPLANFFASGVLRLREKLGPVLWQLPPTLRFEPARLAGFLAWLPRDTAAALALARRRDRRIMKGRSSLAIDACRPLRHAIEVRHPSFEDDRFIEMLAQAGVALVVSESARRWPLLEDVTADFLYLRLHGERDLYRSGYGPRALERWARRIEAWAAGAEPADARKVSSARAASRQPRDVYCFFDNTDVKLRAPVDARALMRRLSLPAAQAGVALAGAEAHTVLKVSENWIYRGHAAR
jgi:uncharacterized protein YecE (DUF72 family)